MFIERSGFLLIAGTLAAGGVGGWLAHDSRARRERTGDAESAAVQPAKPVESVVVVEQAPPACDDSVGVPADCPVAVGPADEGMCSNVAVKRCAEFKSAFKPKVAAAAVACLRQLKSNEQCDPTRVNLCGHTALMAACPEIKPTPTPAIAGVAQPLVTSPVQSACESIVNGCANRTLAPSLADCRQTLAGMTDAGRVSMSECMATHCADKGLLGCEALKKT